MPEVIITAPEGETAVPLNVNGRRYPFQYGVPVDLPAEAISALRNSDLTFTLTDEDSPAQATEGNGDAGGDDAPGGQSVAASDTDFDPEQVILGTVPVVEERLANLTRDQLLAVKAAEDDREQARVGVLTAIDKALEAFEAE